MSKFINCIQGHVDSNRLSQGQADRLLSKYQAKVEQLKKQGKASSAATQAAESLLKTEMENSLSRSRQKIQHALKLKEVNEAFDKMSGPEHRKLDNLLQTAADAGDRVKAEFGALIDSIADDIKGNFFGARNHGQIKQAVKAMMGEIVEDPEAQRIGKILRQGIDFLYSKYKATGGNIGFVKNYFPSIHESIKLKNAKKEVWVEDMLNAIDPERMIDESTGIPFTPEKLRKVTENAYDDIITHGGASLARKIERGEVLEGTGRAADIGQQRNLHRFFVFKSADAQLEYNAKYGRGDNGLAEMLFDYVEAFSRDIGIMEEMGPMSDAMMSSLKARMKAKGVGGVRIKYSDSMYKVLRGLGSTGGSDSMWWRLLTGTQGWIRSSALGSALISAISDVSFITSTSKINGLEATKVLGTFGRLLAGDKELTKLARESGFMVDVLGGSTLSDTRIAGEYLGGRLMKSFARATNRLSGLDIWTRRVKDGIALEYNSKLASLFSSKASWKNLDRNFRESLERMKITEDEWNLLKKHANVFEHESGKKFFSTNDLRTSKDLNTKTAHTIANKIDNGIFALRRQAANEAGLGTRAITTGAIFGDGSTGSLSRATASSLFMFKTFPISVIQLHLLPALRRANIPETLGHIKNMKVEEALNSAKTGRYDHLTQIAILTTVMGAIPLILGDLVKGKFIDDPEKVFTPKFLMAAIMQGGGFGILGDFLLQDRSRFGRSFGSDLAGPMVGTIDDIYRATKGNFDRYLDGKDPNYLRDSFRLLKRNTPVVGSLWYTRLALERLLFDNLERLADPRFDSKMRKLERKMQREQGKKFWWRP